MKSYAQIKKIEKANKERWCKVAGKQITERSGIYILWRSEDGFKYAYIGQAKHLLTRLAQHSSGYKQHIDKSLKKHRLYDEEINPTGWQVFTIEYPENELNEQEQKWIRQMADKGFQLLNKTTGSQSDTKQGLDVEQKQPKGYYDGVKHGYNKARKEVKHLFDLHLTAAIKSNKPHKTQEKALQKFKDFMNGAE